MSSTEEKKEEKIDEIIVKMSLKECKEENNEEMQYLDLVRLIIKTAAQKIDRTKIGTLSIFGAMSRYSLRGGILPLLTTKKMFWRGFFEELMWFIRGQTDERILAKKNVHIWAGNARDFHKKRVAAGDLEHIDGDCGKSYGFRWRSYGAPYINCETNYKGQGVDQLMNVINLIKSNPTSRRILLDAWDPACVEMEDNVALPPCHVVYQFSVTDGELSCILFQRSADVGLGLPANLFSASLFTHMLAHICDLLPGDFCHMTADTHIYKNHIEPMKVQVERTPRPFPTIHIKRRVTNIEDFQFEDFELRDYNPHPAIKMEMAV